MSSIIYNGHEIQDLIVNGNQAQLWLNGQKLYPSAPVDPYNPLGLPPYTIRCKFEEGITPSPSSPSLISWDSVTLVDADENVWDIVKNSTNWSMLLRGFSEAPSHLVSVLGANTTGVTDMSDMFHLDDITTVPLFDTSSCTDMSSIFDNCTSLTTVPLFDTGSCTDMRDMFNGCTSLTTVPLFDTGSCTDMSSMFSRCTSLTTVPLFDTSSCTNMMSMFSTCTSLTSIPLFDTSSCTNMRQTFRNCYNVQSGALALYQQAYTQATPPTNHTGTFQYCGRDTVTGAAELAQIPTDWGGTMSA